VKGLFPQICAIIIGGFAERDLHEKRPARKREADLQERDRDTCKGVTETPARQETETPARQETETPARAR